MKRTLVTLATFAIFCAIDAVTPVQKAIELLKSMVDKAEANKHEEAVQFAAFKQFCDDVSVEKTRLIEEAEELQEQLRADILQFDAEVDRLSQEIVDHQNEITGWNQDLEAAQRVRTDERTNYTVTLTDYTESIDALDKAIRTLKAQNYDRAGTMASALLQKVKNLHRLPAAAKKTIDAFLDVSQDPDNVAPEVPITAYEFQSGDIIDMLEQLKTKFMDEKTALEKEEVQSRATYDSVKQSLTDSIKQGKNAITEKTSSVNRNKQSSIDANAQLAIVTETHDSDVKYLKDLTSSCQAKSSEFNARQKLRAEEIEALEKAVQILSSDDVSGSAEEHLPSMLQKATKASFAQLRSSSSSPESQQRVVEFLREQADRMGSKTLAALALKVQDDPFGKVKKLIQELITRLMTESTNEAEHKGWCDTELATNKFTRETKSAEVETLSSTIDSLTSRIDVLTKDLADLNQAVADIDEAVAKATELRNNETADNAATVQDAKDGQTAIDQAITVLKDFYAKAAEATALVQKKGRKQPDDAPPIFDSPYQGLQSDKGGILGMLEVIKSDFVRLESDTKAAESAAQAEYDSFMEDSSIDKAQKEQDIKAYTSEKLEKEGKLSETRDSLSEAQEILNTALASFEKLKPACLGGGMSYEERVNRRRDEIEALKEALNILEGYKNP